MHRGGAQHAPKLDSLELEPIKEKKGDKSPAFPVPPDIKKKIEKIRSIKYEKANDLKRTYEKRSGEILALIEREGSGFFSAYRCYIQSTEKGLIERHHPLSLFLSQYDDTWRERARSISDHIEQEAEKKQDREIPTDEERQEVAEGLRHLMEGLKIGSA